MSADEPTRHIDRRRALALLGAAGAAVLVPAACSSSSSKSAPTTGGGGDAAGSGDGTTVPSPTTASPAACKLTAELTQGPYYLDLELVRRDLTGGQAGVPLTFRTTVVDQATCRPVPDAAVDIWHCNAAGIYSGFTSVGNGAPGPGGGLNIGTHDPNDHSTWLRGVQITDARGVAEFATIYPGWYTGRAIHIHTKVHLGGQASQGTYHGGHVSHTGQVFFPASTTATVAGLDPYRSNAAKLLANEQDAYYPEGGPATIATLTPVDRADPAKAFVATITVSVDPSATPRVT